MSTKPPGSGGQDADADAVRWFDGQARVELDGTLRGDASRIARREGDPHVAPFTRFAKVIAVENAAEAAAVRECLDEALDIEFTASRFRAARRVGDAMRAAEAEFDD